MHVTVVWSSQFLPEAKEDGLALTKQIWEDMRSFEGYLSHQILIDVNDPCHIIQLGVWESSTHADNVRDLYKNSPIIAKMTPLLKEPRERWITAKA